MQEMWTLTYWANGKMVGKPEKVLANGDNIYLSVAHMELQGIGELKITRSRIFEPSDVAPETVWKHYKGGRYKVRSIVSSTSNDQKELEPMVVYDTVLHDSDLVAHTHTAFVRNLSEWLGEVNDESYNYHGPRFIMEI